MPSTKTPRRAAVRVLMCASRSLLEVMLVPLLPEIFRGSRAQLTAENRPSRRLRLPPSHPCAWREL